MPAKNTIKIYLKEAYYHIYSRGVDKREIFLDKEDCIMFQRLLKLYLSPPEVLLLEKEITPRRLHKITFLNIYNEVDLISFSLMPNHFHLQVKQTSFDGIIKLTRRVLTSYAQYFNNKYKRKGPLFESTYRAVLVETDEQLLYLSSYIHRNPMKLKNPKFDFTEFSSLPYYLGEKKAYWLKPKVILDYFHEKKGKGVFSYESFVKDFRENPEEILEELTLDKD